MPFDILVACTKNGGIGKNGTIPWYLPPDLKLFQTITSKTEDPNKQNAIIMGKNTWYSLPKRPLQNRRNVVLTTSSMEEEYKKIIENGGEIYKNLEDALHYLEKDPRVENIFVIGGSKLYETSILHNKCRNIYITYVDRITSQIQRKTKMPEIMSITDPYQCDKFFPIDILNNVNNNSFISIDYASGFTYKDISYSYITYVSQKYLQK